MVASANLVKNKLTLRIYMKINDNDVLFDSELSFAKKERKRKSSAFYLS